MKVSFEVGGKTVSVELQAEGAGHSAVVDGRPCRVEATWISARDLSLIVDGRSYDLQLIPAGPGQLDIAVDGRIVRVGQGGDAATGLIVKHHHGGERLTAPMSGKVIAVLVEPGEPVVVGQGLVIIEAMKMENELLASCAGTVKSIQVIVGQVVEGGATLVEIA